MVAADQVMEGVLLIRVRLAITALIRNLSPSQKPPISGNINTFKMGEAFLDLALIAGHQPYKFSIHLTASTSLTLPRYRWVVERFACLKMTLLTISTGTPDLEA